MFFVDWSNVFVGNGFLKFFGGWGDVWIDGEGCNCDFGVFFLVCLGWVGFEDNDFVFEFEWSINGFFKLLWCFV